MGKRDISGVECILYEGGGYTYVHSSQLFVSQHIDFERKVEGYTFKFNEASIMKAEGKAQALIRSMGGEKVVEFIR